MIWLGRESGRLIALVKRRSEHMSITFIVRVIPRSSRSEIVGEYDGAVKVRLTSPPVDGAANNELIKLFSKTLGVSRSAVEILSGANSKTKRLRVAGVTDEQLRRVISPLPSPVTKRAVE